MNRIEKKFEELGKRGEKAFVTYMTAGLPTMEDTKKIIRAQEKAGTDVVEIGVPFSDPTADGPVIQAASYEAICKGVTLRKVFTAVEEMRREGVEIPIIFMMYYNTILHFGVENFVKKCKEAGVDGLIVPDLPLEEQDEMKEQLNKSDDTILIQLVSPVSAKRIPAILKDARGFVYCVSAMGVTGQSGSFHKEVANYLQSVKEVSKIPVLMGFGIREAKDVAPMKDVIDGAIVGTHFIELMKEHNFSEQVVTDYCSKFKQELNAL